MIAIEKVQEFERRIDALEPNTKAKWGKMNATQMLTHMNDAIRIGLGMKAAVDKSNWFMNKLAFPIVVHLFPGFPRNLLTAPEMKQGKLGSTPRDFYTEAEFLKKMLEVFNEREGDKLKPHPLFGKLSKQQWADLLVKHLEHHLQQFGV